VEKDVPQMIFEFINPSDPYHFTTDNLKVASVTTFILGVGKCGAKEIDSNKDKLFEVPFLLFGGEEEWTQKTFNMSLSELLHDVKVNHKQDLVNCLESFVIGSFSEYKKFQENINKISDEREREKFKKQYHKKKLTSANDFGTYAWAFARELKKSED
jgi:hypothetical protein